MSWDVNSHLPYSQIKILIPVFVLIFSFILGLISVRVLRACMPQCTHGRQRTTFKKLFLSFYLTFEDFILVLICMCICLGVCAYECIGQQRPERVLDPLNLQSYVVVICLLWMLVSKPGISGRTVSTLNC